MNQKWYVRWRKNGWKNSQQEPVVNKDLWVRLLQFVDNYQINFYKVKGHSGNYLNERADQLARTAVKEISKNNIDMIIIDTESTDVKLEINKKLSEASKALYYHINNMNQENVSNVLKLEGIVNSKM